VKSLVAALWAFRDAEDFRQVALRTADLGDDADTSAVSSTFIATQTEGATVVAVEVYSISTTLLSSLG
jgi:ADP-ribosylglycohydrolase